MHANIKKARDNGIYVIDFGTGRKSKSLSKKISKLREDGCSLAKVIIDEFEFYKSNDKSLNNKRGIREQVLEELTPEELDAIIAYFNVKNILDD